jgi:hypothetical protein
LSCMAMSTAAERPLHLDLELADALTGTILTRVGLPGLMPLPWSQTLAIFAYAMVSCLVVNDAVKVVTIKGRVPTAIAYGALEPAAHHGRILSNEPFNREIRQ